MASFSRELEETIHRALSVAEEMRHELATLEHLLYSLIDDKDALEVMLACDVDIQSLKADVEQYLLEDLTALKVNESEELDEVRPTAGFHRVVQRAVIHVQTSGREEVSGSNALIALFAERESHAVYFLQERDMTRYDAINYISRGISKTSNRDDIEAELISLPEGMSEVIRSIPKQKPASLQTGWFMNKVRADIRETTSKHNDEQALATLISLKVEMRSTLEAISEESNVDKRIVKYFEETIELIPEKIPDNLLLQRLSIREKTLSAFIPAAKKEWAEFTSQNFQVVCNEFSLTLDQFSERREFNRNIIEIELEERPHDEVSGDIDAVVAFFKGKTASSRIDVSVAENIESIGEKDHLNTVGIESSPAEVDLTVRRNADKLESLNNTIKSVAERAFSDENSAAILSALEGEYVSGFGTGLKEGAREAGEEDGRLTAKGLMRAKAAKEVSEIGGRKLAQRYPKVFGWMNKFFDNDLEE